MGETYRGYQITIAWNSETTGYDFIITPPDNGKIITSEDSYFYDYKQCCESSKVKSMNFSSKTKGAEIKDFFGVVFSDVWK